MTRLVKNPVEVIIITVDVHPDCALWKEMSASRVSYCLDENYQAVKSMKVIKSCDIISFLRRFAGWPSPIRKFEGNIPWKLAYVIRALMRGLALKLNDYLKRVRLRQALSIETKIMYLSFPETESNDSDFLSSYTAPAPALASSTQPELQLHRQGRSAPYQIAYSAAACDLRVAALSFGSSN
jgi:hypothetical protein